VQPATGEGVGGGGQSVPIHQQQRQYHSQLCDKACRLLREVHRRVKSTRHAVKTIRGKSERAHAHALRQDNKRAETEVGQYLEIFRACTAQDYHHHHHHGAGGGDAVAPPLAPPVPYPATVTPTDIELRSAAPTSTAPSAAVPAYAPAATSTVGLISGHDDYDAFQGPPAFPDTNDFEHTFEEPLSDTFNYTSNHTPPHLPPVVETHRTGALSEKKENKKTKWATVTQFGKMGPCSFDEQRKPIIVWFMKTRGFKAFQSAVIRRQGDLQRTIDTILNNPQSITGESDDFIIAQGLAYLVPGMITRMFITAHNILGFRLRDKDAAVELLRAWEDEQRKSYCGELTKTILESMKRQVEERRESLSNALIHPDTMAKNTMMLAPICYKRHKDEARRVLGPLSPPSSSSIPDTNSGGEGGGGSGSGSEGGGGGDDDNDNDDGKHNDDGLDSNHHHDGGGGDGDGYGGASEGGLGEIDYGGNWIDEFFDAVILARRLRRRKQQQLQQQCYISDGFAAEERKEEEWDLTDPESEQMASMIIRHEAKRVKVAMTHALAPPPPPQQSEQEVEEVEDDDDNDDDDDEEEEKQTQHAVKRNEEKYQPSKQRSNKRSINAAVAAAASVGAGGEEDDLVSSSYAPPTMHSRRRRSAPNAVRKKKKENKKEENGKKERKNKDNDSNSAKDDARSVRKRKTPPGRWGVGELDDECDVVWPQATRRFREGSWREGQTHHGWKISNPKSSPCRDSPLPPDYYYLKNTSSGPASMDCCCEPVSRMLLFHAECNDDKKN